MYLINLIKYKVLNFDEMTLVCPLLSSCIDRTHIIRSVVTPLTFKLTRHIYLALMRMNFFNLAFDDEQDRLFIFDWAIFSTELPTKIDFQIDLANLSIFCLDTVTLLPTNDL